MKKFNSLWMGGAVLALLATGCAKELGNDGPKPYKTGSTDIIVTIAAAEAETRALLGDDNATTIQKFEDNVVEFVAYLFDGDGLFLEQGTTTEGAKQIIFPGYEVDDKIQVVAFANSTASHVTLPSLTVGSSTVADLQKGILTTTLPLSAEMITDFTDITNGLFMSGQFDLNNKTGVRPAVPVDPIWTVVEGPNKIEVPVERVVARIELTGISFDPSVTIGDIIRFQIYGGAAQKAVGSAYVYPGEIDTYPASPQYYGGYASIAGTPTTSVLAGLKDMGTDGAGLLDIGGLVVGLLEAIEDNASSILGLLPGTDVVVIPILEAAIDTVESLLDGTLTGASILLGYLDQVALNQIPVLSEINISELLKTPNLFWYVLPNNDPLNPTLLTLQGEYMEEPWFYPVAINAANNAGKTTGDTTDGTNIKRNMRYTVNITFKNLMGTKDPNDPSLGTNLIVTVKPVPWEGPVNQNTTW